MAESFVSELKRRNVFKVATAYVVLAWVVVQVTDLAVLHDLRTLEGLMKTAPSKRFWVGGCLARRFDIPLPDGVERLDHIRTDYQPIEDKSLVHYAPPFWVKDFKEDDGAYADGHLFRKQLRIRGSRRVAR